MSFARPLSSLLVTALLFAAATTGAQAAWTVTWNPYGSPGNYAEPVTYDGTSSGSVRNTTAVIDPSPFSLTGHGDAAQTSRLTLTSVPAAYDAGYYIELPLTVQTGFAFEPQELRIATLYGINPGVGTSDRSASFQVRSSIDNFSTLIGTSAVDPASGRNPISGGGGFANYDQVAGVSSLGAITGSVTFRIYFQDTNGSVNIGSSVETLPEGLRIVGPDAYAVPEPTAGLLALLLPAGLWLGRRR
jgi:hypothetical protein